MMTAWSQAQKKLKKQYTRQEKRQYDVKENIQHAVK